jgi:hypothetical protein
MFNKSIKIAFSAIVLAGAFSLASASPGNAESVMKMCGDQWKAAKAAGTTGGKTWPEFLSQCRAGGANAAAPAPAAPAPAPKAPAPAAPMATGGSAGEHSRIHECSLEWKQAKATNQTGGLKWPQFWHQCDVRLKAAGR